MLQLALATPTLRIVMDDREQQKAWVRAMARLKQMSPSALATEAGIVPSTLNRFLNNPNATHKLSNETLGAIAEVAGVRPMEYPDRRPSGFGETEAEPYRFDAPGLDPAFERAIRVLCQERTGRDPWILKHWGLDAIGYMPGDVVIVDLNLRPVQGDVVCAQVYDWARDRAETLMRVFDPPFLLSASTRLGVQKPLMVDDESVTIKGVVTNMMRPRRAA